MVLPAWAADQPGGASAPPLQLVRDPNGDGYVLTGAGLWLGGDGTVTAQVPQGSRASVDLDDLDVLFRYEPTPRLAFFNETRLENTLSLEEGTGLTRGTGDLSIERLYADFALTPQLTVRGGKMLTPFGLWNVIPRAPLTWTVSRPLATQIFPEHSTGLSLIYQTTWHGWSLDATGYGPTQDELALRRSEESGSRFLAGGRVAVAHTLGPAYAAIGLNASGFEEAETKRWANSYGTDLDLTLPGNDLTGELAYTRLRGPDLTREWGFYLQDVFPLLGSFYGILRVEYFSPRRGPDQNAQLAGIFWRPVRHLIVKADYQIANHASDQLPRGFLASVSLFF